MIIKPTAPYDFDRVLAKLGGDPLYEYNHEERQLILVQPLDHKHVLVSLKNKGTIEEPAIEVQILSDDITTKPEVDQLKAVLSKRFGWQDERLVHFYADMQQQGSSLLEVIQLQRGLPLVLDDSLEACLFKTIIHQQVHIKVARLVVFGLAEAFGERIEWQEQAYYAFPTSDKISQLTVGELRTYKLSQRKAEYLHGLATAISTGELNLEHFADQSNEQVIDTLCKLRGIGKWTAECFLLFGLGRQNLFPVGDLGIRKAIGIIEQMEATPTQEEAALWSKGKEAWGSYIALYLWERLGNMSLPTKKG